MKRVSIGFLIFYFSWYIAVYMCGSHIGIELNIPRWFALVVFCICFFGWLIAFPLYYPKTFEKRLIKLAGKKNIEGIGFRTDFFIPESYYIDTTNGYLIGIALFNPFKYQYIDLKNVTDIELVTKVFTRQ